MDDPLMDDRADLIEKIRVYEQFLHDLQMYAAVVMDPKKVGILIGRACDWSYAHRQGNGALSDDEQSALVRRAFLRLTDVKDSKTSD